MWTLECSGGHTFRAAKRSVHRLSAQGGSWSRVLQMWLDRIGCAVHGNACRQLVPWYLIETSHHSAQSKALEG